MSMELDSIPQQLMQPTLFEYGDTASGAVELFPAVWTAAEALLAPELLIRQQGLARLIELGAPRLSPLIAAILATRLSEPDLELRRQIAYTLGDILTVDEHGRAAPELVRSYLVQMLGQMRQRPIFALLEVSISDPMAEATIARLLNACPYAGRHLADILSERKMPLAVRRSATHFIGLVGYLDAIPSLERMLARLETRAAGQQVMPFAPPGQPDEADLLPEIRTALASLETP
jgi:HEAT repeat protein